ncbi:chitobiase/beta-hexosaminidase C-terminal domain-containing protein [Lachnospiraceae bacterium OttesenSCG-928-J05]|nr:chitobiase/beta-hexosaminidase C-terminal domain-containing protein [Lachnospiraceae bacterium OttesenSCG-928-J05]
MKCKYCGTQIDGDSLKCPHCGREARIVPDYNPIDDVLEAQIKDSLAGEDNLTGDDDYLETVVLNNTYGGKKRPVKRATYGGRRTRTISPRDLRKAEIAKRKAQKKKKRRILLITMAILAVVLVIASLLIYSNSYTGMVKKGYSLTEEKKYDEAIAAFNKAIAKKPEKPEAYTGLSKVFLAQDDLEQAEAVFSKAIGEHPDNVDIYEAYILFYLDTDQQAKIPGLLSGAPEKVQDKLSKYLIPVPEFSLDEGVVYDVVQELSLTADDEDIYYTVDGSQPVVGAENTTKYTEPIQINNEGDTTITAIAVNDEDIPSVAVAKVYTIELPIVDAPSVKPSTGQYDEPTKIEIVVPEGYTAFYTLDKSDPTNGSIKYEGPIDMPEGTTIFKAVLVDSRGKLSAITTRNYIYEP